MKVIKVVALALLQCINVFILSAQQPNVVITLDNSIPISYPYDEVIKLPNGNLQFYKMTTSYGSIQVIGFQFLLQTNTLTDVVQIGSVIGIPGECQYQLGTQRFGKFYCVYQYPNSYNPLGLVVLRLDANTIAYRIIDDMGFCAGSAIFHTEIVAEDSFVFALEDSLVYYDFTSDTSQTLLDGEVYQCTPEQDKRVYAMPDGHFVYIKDSMMGNDNVPETWIIYDSQGNYQFTKTLTNPWFGVSVVGTSFFHDFQSINGRFYIPNISITSDDGWLECHFPDPDTLHYFVVAAPGSPNEGSARFVRFGDDRILRSYFDYGEEQTYLYMNNSPLEYNPAPTHWTSIGPIAPHLNNINDYLVTNSMRLENLIYISALCTLDFPSPHVFTFPAPPVNVYLPSIAFPYTDKLLFISDGVVYAFNVAFTVANADETAVPPVQTLSAYPNPVNMKDVITFKASLKQTMELDIYNIRGQRVDTLTLDSDGIAQWDLHNHKGEALSAGVYFAKPRNNKGIKPFRFIAIH